MTTTVTMEGTSRDMNHVFVSDLIKGEYGEYLVKKHLTNHDLVTEIEDKSGVERYQKADIDMLVRFEEDGDITSLEVKNDMTLFQNLFFESRSAIKPYGNDSPGCLLVTEADFLFYVYSAINVVLIVSVKELGKWVSNELMEDSKAFRRVNPKNKGYTSEGYLVPIPRLMGAYGSKAVPTIVIKDLTTNEKLTYNEYNARRKAKHAEIGSNYVDIYAEEGWREENEAWFANQDALEIELLANEERLEKANRKLAFLDTLYDK